MPKESYRYTVGRRKEPHKGMGDTKGPGQAFTTLALYSLSRLLSCNKQMNSSFGCRAEALLSLPHDNQALMRGWRATNLSYLKANRILTVVLRLVTTTTYMRFVQDGVHLRTSVPNQMAKYKAFAARQHRVAHLGYTLAMQYSVPTISRVSTKRLLAFHFPFP